MPERATGGPFPHLRRRLAATFIAEAARADDYARRVERECSMFPEGDLFPFVFSAIGLCALCGCRDTMTLAAHEASTRLLELSTSTTATRLSCPIEQVAPGSGEAVYLGWQALALCAFRIGWDDARFDRHRKHLCSILLADLVARRGAPMDSFPGVCWPFDTIPVLAALKLNDAIEGETGSATAIEDHLRWVDRDAREAPLGLPQNLIDRGSSTKNPPRGCELSLRVMLMELVDPQRGQAIYRRYSKSFWQERGWIAGFREWPRGHHDSADADSGPIVAGLGMAATGFGLGATAVARDRWRLWRLSGELNLVRAMLALAAAGERWVRPWIEKGLPRAASDLWDPRSITGFLFGDASLFLTLSLPCLAQRTREFRAGFQQTPALGRS